MSNYFTNLANELGSIDLSSQDSITTFIIKLENRRTYINHELEEGLAKATLLRERNFPEQEVLNYINKVREQARCSRQFLSGIISTLEGILRSLNNGYQRNLIRGLTSNR